MPEQAPTKSKELIRPIPVTWWLNKKTYSLFMLRELTSVFVGGYAIYLLVLLWNAQNARSFETFVQSMSNPISILLHLLALGMALYHSITWFNLTPKAMVVWRGEEKLSPVIIAGSNYVVWAIVSILLICIVLRAG